MTNSSITSLSGALQHMQGRKFWNSSPNSQTAWRPPNERISSKITPSTPRPMTFGQLRSLFLRACTRAARACGQKERTDQLYYLPTGVSTSDCISFMKRLASLCVRLFSTSSGPLLLFFSFIFKTPCHPRRIQATPIFPTGLWRKFCLRWAQCPSRKK